MFISIPRILFQTVWYFYLHCPCSNDVLLQTVPSIPPMSWYPVNKLTHRFVLNLSSLYIDHYSMLVRWGSVLWDFHLKNKDYAESTVRFTAPLRERLSCGRSSPCLLVSLEKGRCMQMSCGPWKICWLNPHLSSLICVNRRQFQHSTLASNAQTHGRHYPQSYTHNIVIYIYCRQLMSFQQHLKVTSLPVLLF